MPLPLNILWILTDEQRADSLGSAGSMWARTPCLDDLAAGGIRFDAAYTPSPVCVPARAALLTGQTCSRLGVLNNHHALLPARARFLTHELRDREYQTASFGKSHYNCRCGWAFDIETGRVLDDKVGYMEYRVPVDERTAGVVYYPSEFRHWVLAGRFPGAIEETAESLNAREALDWLRQRDRQLPFLLRLSLNAPHTPVVAPAPYDTLIDPDAITLPFDTRDSLPLPEPIREHLCEVAGAQHLTRDQIRRGRQVYYGRAAFVDEVVRRFLDEAQHAGALDNTLIVFTSDHGCHLGDHGFFQKQSFYEASVRVPLIVAGEMVAPATVETPVNIASLLPTMLELAGIDVPQSVDYPSLASTICSGAEPPAIPIVSELDFGVWDYRDGHRYTMVRDGNWKLALFRDPEAPDRFRDDDGAMLHNLSDDPGERHNLAGDPQCAAVQQRLLELIDEWDRGITQQ